MEEESKESGAYSLWRSFNPEFTLIKTQPLGNTALLKCPTDGTVTGQMLSLCLLGGKEKAVINSLIQEKQLMESTACSFCMGRSVTPSSLPVADEKMSFYPKSPESPAMCTPLDLQHFGIRSTIWASPLISHPKIRFVLDLIPALIFWDELTLFYFP